MSSADRIDDATLRELFLTNIAEHRELVSSWRERQVRASR
jgi:hypothetical protein